jgi:hypothetical protein
MKAILDNSFFSFPIARASAIGKSLVAQLPRLLKSTSQLTKAELSEDNVPRSAGTWTTFEPSIWTGKV